MSDIAILLYDRFTALDAIGPYEVLSRLPGWTLSFVAAEPGPVQTDNGRLTLVVEHSIDALPSPDIVLVPGGPGEVAARAGGPALEHRVSLTRRSPNPARRGFERTSCRTDRRDPCVLAATRL